MATKEIIGNTATAISCKPFKFEGSHLKHWKSKMKIFSTLKKVANILTEGVPVSHSGSTEQSNCKKTVNFDETVNSAKLDSDAQVKQQMIYNSGKKSPYGKRMIISIKTSF